MKIRTNFVTNSSSYSSAEIKIDNPVLLEILKKYKEKGTFDETWFETGCIGVNAKKQKKEILLDYCVEEDEIREELEGYNNKKVALFFYDPEDARIDYAPDKIEDVIGCLLKMIDEKVGYEECKELKKEIAERTEEINSNYKDVIWKAQDYSSGESEPEEGEQTEWNFEYHKK